MLKRIFFSLFILIMLLSYTGCNEKIDIQTMDDLYGKKIGVNIGTTGEILANEIDKASVYLYQDTKQALDALFKNDIHAVIVDSGPAEIFLGMYDGLKILDGLFEEEEYAICLSKDKFSLTTEFNTALTELTKNGTIDNIINYHVHKDPDAKQYISPFGTNYTRGKLTALTEASFPPYEYYGTDERLAGADIDIAKAVCDYLGFDLVIYDVNFDDIIPNIVKGEADFGIAAISKTAERETLVDFTKSYTTASQVVIIRE